MTEKDCAICKLVKAKYRCPSCLVGTCSLDCVQAHKKASGCTGKRPRSDNVSIQNFSDSVLYKDFDLLDEANTTLYRCRPNAKPDVLRKRDKLKSECYQRNIHLKLMPHVFSMAQKNSSTIRSRKETTEDTQSVSVSSEILWKVDWVFTDIKQTLSDTCVSETRSIRELLCRFFEDTWRLGPTMHLFQDSGISSASDLQVFLLSVTKEEIPMNIDVPLREALNGQSFIEYPIFHIRRQTPDSSEKPSNSMLPPKPSNIPSSVWGRIGRNLYQNKSHPVGIVSSKIHKHFNMLHEGKVFKSYDLPPTPIVTTTQAFDNLLVPKSHPLRSTSDTYYVSESTVLRPHATSHQRDVLQSLRQDNGCNSGAIWTCDVYRKDEVDRIHFPVFHQTDGVGLFGPKISTDEIVKDLQNSLEQLLGTLFHEAQIPLEMRWDYTATFPFTDPSMELEIRLPNDPRWIECLGCGKIKTEIDSNGWAFGIGIDRLAMLLFNIEDIRLLWSEDVRFLSQFSENQISKFKPFSKYPPTARDTAFWLGKESEFDEKIFSFNCMQLAGPYGLESVSVVDQFTKGDKVSRCFRFTYRGIEKTLTSDECNDIHKIVNEYISDQIGGVIR